MALGCPGDSICVLACLRAGGPGRVVDCPTFPALGHRAIMRASNHFVWSETTADDAFTVEWEGRRYVCPRYPRLRMLEGAVAFNATYPGSMLLPDVTAQRLAAELETIRADAPDARSYILTSPWHVPLRWFVPFLPEQKEVYELAGVTSARYRTTVGAGLPRVARAAANPRRGGFRTMP